MMTNGKNGQFRALVALRTMMQEMERDMGLNELSAAEQNVLLAAFAVAEDSDGQMSSEAIRQHVLVADIAQATFHRALRKLLEIGYIAKAPGFKSTKYVLK